MPYILAILSYISDNSVMTEITNNTEKLAPAIEKFILHWGDLGGQWGVNRSVAQIHALLYVSNTPLTAESIADTLGLARSNVSNSIKELLGWQLIHRVPMLGDRRDHFAAETDIWAVIRHIAKGRKTREIDPAADVLNTCLEMAKNDDAVNPIALQRIQDMLVFVQTISRWYDQMLTIPKNKLAMLIKMGAKVTRFLTPNRNKASSNNNI